MYGHKLDLLIVLYVITIMNVSLICRAIYHFLIITAIRDVVFPAKSVIRRNYWLIDKNVLVLDPNVCHRVEDLPEDPDQVRFDSLAQYKGYCEYLWVHSDLSVHFDTFQVAKLHVQTIVVTTKFRYFFSKISAYKDR